MARDRQRIMAQRILEINAGRCPLTIENDPNGNWHVKVGTMEELVGGKLYSLIYKAYSWWRNTDGENKKAIRKIIEGMKAEDRGDFQQ